MVTQMNENETAAPVRAFDRAYISGQFVTPHGTQVVDLVNPTNNRVIGKVTMADEIDTRHAIAAAKDAFNTFSQSSKEYRMDCLQRLYDSVAKRMDQLVDATVLEYGAPQDRKSTRLNSSLRCISYAVFCLKKKNHQPDKRYAVSRETVGAPDRRLASCLVRFV